MLTIQDVLENKKRYSKLETQNFTYYRAAVIDSETGMEVLPHGRFNMLPDDLIMKHLALAYDAFSKKIDDQMFSFYRSRKAFGRKTSGC